MKRSFVLGLAVSTLGLAGCDNTPNAQFDERIKGPDAGKSRDPYAALERGMLLQNDYISWSEAGRRNMTRSQGGRYGDRYEELLKTLADDKAVATATNSALFAACRPAFAAAIDFQRGTPPAADMAPEAAAVALRACRERTQAAVSAGGADAAGAALLSRFASAGLALVGIAAVARGEEKAGLAVWGEGEKLSRRDQPDFKIDASSFK